MQTIRLNHNTDSDILRWLEKQPSKASAIKQAIRYFLAASTSEK